MYVRCEVGYVLTVGYIRSMETRHVIGDMYGMICEVYGDEERGDM